MKTFNILNIVFIITIAFIIFGCGTTTFKQLPPEKVVVTETQDVVRVEKCEVPDLSKICTFTGDYFGPTERLLNCVIAQKKVLDYCAGKTNDDGID